MLRSLIIDDEKPVQIAISKLGHFHYYGIETPQYAVNGKDGLSAMREFHPDIVFVDMSMPVMDGCTFLEKAHEEFPGSQYIVVSGYDDFSYAQHALRNGACDYLLKPVDEESLNRAIEKAVKALNPDAVFGNAPESDDPVTPDQIVSIIKEYLESNYHTNIRISMFSEKYFFSQEYLNKLFKSKYGYTIYEYVLKLRMERAAELLSQPDIKISDIAERLGYADNHYFSKAFRTYYQVTPTEYRKKLNPSSTEVL